MVGSEEPITATPRPVDPLDVARQIEVYLDKAHRSNIEEHEWWKLILSLGHLLYGCIASPSVIAHASYHDGYNEDGYRGNTSR